uniref:Retrotransposon gag domain-containing protein n=1 Tax=Populus alba TaxID=43335 RepID=A0A4U5Q698_POPAL|nr:hypothetical protein D5086_0000129700 [Populus alba]
MRMHKFGSLNWIGIVLESLGKNLNDNAIFVSAHPFKAINWENFPSKFKDKAAPWRNFNEYIAIEMELHRPRDLISAMSLARLYERRSGAKRFIPAAYKPSSNTSSSSSNQKTFKRLSRTEMDERRAKGLCFNCDEVYNWGHQYKRLFWLDGVVVANGSKIKSPGQCPNVPIMMGNQLIHIDFYILKLNGVDAVLGVNWLQTLGPILWDFKAKSMIFKQNGRVMEL